MENDTLKFSAVYFFKIGSLVTIEWGGAIGNF
jgi:hypothetical protein